MTRFFNKRTAAVGLVILLLILAAGLAADLRFHGLAWRYLYSVTGEEAPASQISGFLGYLSNLTRLLPSTTGALPALQRSANPLGVNTLLEDEVEPAKREQQMRLIRAAGFGWVRQQFRWDDLEISGRGDFTDKRNSPSVSAWDKYDDIVSLAETFDTGIIARLGSPPAWSQSSTNAVPGYAPPADVEDFVNYARAVATRYKGRVHHYQVWNEPNIFPEWGTAAPDPEAYTDMLCRTYKALKEIDPTITVLTGPLAPTAEISDRNLNDLIYLQRMYDAGAASCFDVLSVQGYGLRSGPTDQRLRAMNINFNHPQYLRDIMISNGDAAKPVWISEMSWNPVPDDPAIQGKDSYGRVTDEQAARYTVDAYKRIAAEWPWVDVVNYWFFKRADDGAKNQSWYYFRMVEPDFTPRPVYDAIKQYATSR